MNHGALTVFCGPMFAGKTEELIKEILYASAMCGGEISRATFKPSVDTRYSVSEIVSHDGVSVPATPVASASEIDVGDVRAVFFDEVQFFCHPHFSGSIMDLIRKIRRRGIDVYCAGLDTDYLGHAFEITASLMAEATTVRRLSATCDCCGAPATKTARHGGDLERLLLGNDAAYSAMCADHWLNHVTQEVSGDLFRTTNPDGAPDA